MYGKLKVEDTFKGWNGSKVTELTRDEHEKLKVPTGANSIAKESKRKIAELLLKLHSQKNIPNFAEGRRPRVPS